MSKTLKTAIFVLLAITLYAKQSSANVDREALLKEIFGSEDEGSTAATVPPTAPPVTKAYQASTIVPGVATKSGGGPCTTASGAAGECVRYYLCNDKDNTVITDGVGLIDIRFQEGGCPSYLDLCCQVPDKLPEDKPITPPPPPPAQIRQGCGWRNPNGVGFRITGDKDNEAKFGEFPWMVAILKEMPVSENQPDSQYLNVYLGGGSLIHPNVVLTAAHSVFRWGDLIVRAGEWDTQTKDEIYPHQEIKVKEVVTHKDFNRGNLFYDVGLLFLTEPVDMSVPHIGLACLPRQGDGAKAGTRCQASGWGKNVFGKEGQYQVILKRVEVPVVSRFTCETQLRRTRLGHHFLLHSSFMCAGGEFGKDVCKGDGGSPLVCPIQYEEDRYVQNGIVAWGIGCGTDGVPGVYVDVANLRGWIDDQVAGRGYDTSAYTN